MPDRLTKWSAKLGANKITSFIAKVVIALLLGLAGLGAYCLYKLPREKARIDAELAVKDSVIAVKDSLIAVRQVRYDSLSRRHDSLEAIAAPGRPVVNAAAAAAWRANERLKIRNAVTLEILDSLGRVEQTVTLPPEVIAGMEQTNEALRACVTQLGREQDVLLACQAAKMEADSLLLEQTGVGQLLREENVLLRQALAIERSDDGIAIGPLRLFLLPKITGGYQVTYNVDCKDETFSTSESFTEDVVRGSGVTESVDEVRTPVDYPPQVRHWAAETNFTLPDQVERTKTIDRLETIDRTVNTLRKERVNGGCQRIVHGPGLQATVFTIKF